LPGARGELLAWVLDVPRCNDFRFFRLCGLNVHRLLVLCLLSFPDVHHARVCLHLNERDDRVERNLNEQGGQVEQNLHEQDGRVYRSLNEQGDLDAKHLHVLDDRVSAKKDDWVALI
jgi:hypothetical protein